MIDDDEIQSYKTNHFTHFEMDEAFCARMRMAIEAGLESAQVGVITTPETKNPIYVPTNLRFFEETERVKTETRRAERVRRLAGSDAKASHGA